MKLHQEDTRSRIPLFTRPEQISFHDTYASMSIAQSAADLCVNDG